MATFVIVWLSNAELDKHRNTHSLNWGTHGILNVTLTARHMDSKRLNGIANSTARGWPGIGLGHNTMPKQLLIDELQRAPNETDNDT